MIDADTVEVTIHASKGLTQQFEPREHRPAVLHRLLFVLGVILLGALTGGVTAWLVAQMLK